MASLLNIKAIKFIKDKPKITKTRLEIIDEGIEFYNRIIKLSNAELAKGNLPLHEAVTGLEQVRRLKALYQIMEKGFNLDAKDSGTG